MLCNMSSLTVRMNGLSEEKSDQIKTFQFKLIQVEVERYIFMKKFELWSTSLTSGGIC